MTNAIAAGRAGLSRLAARATAKRRLHALEGQLDAGLPRQMHAALRYLITGDQDEQSLQVADAVERRRSEIAESHADGISVWYSPKPGSAGEAVTPGMRPRPGQVMQFSAQQVAMTGKDRRWGTAMYLIAREFGCSTGLELGTCGGISAMYVASAPSVSTYVTVEGSADLCQIARESLAAFPAVRVINALFDEALDGELPSMYGSIDFAFVDGHHEKVATIHYADRITPALNDGAVVVFDDISWSEDMRTAWDELRVRPDWSEAIDLGVLGVCIRRGQHEHGSTPRQWALQPLVGKVAIREPWGWRS